MSVVSGTLVLLKLGESGSESVLACSQSSTLTINQEAVPATCKDGDQWVSNTEGNKSFELSTNGLYDPTGENFTLLADLIITGPNSIDFVFGTEAVGDTVYSGTVMLTITALTGDDNTPATYSGTLVGTGPLTSALNV